VLNEKSQKKTKIPIIDAVYEILYEGKEPKKVFQKLTEKLD
jgi:glycerol-3-phosphate dehydrogenase (NAD(P)+)